MIEGGLKLKGFKKDNSNNDLLTIITVVYNGELHIENTIISVIKQDYKNIEYIIIDGGSQDNTLEILKKYDNNIDYWISEPDYGISNAFNKGIKLSQGELIGIINADDYYQENALSHIMNVYDPQDPCILCAGMILKNPNRPDRTWFSTLDGIKVEMTIAHPATFVPKTIYDVFGGFDEQFKMAMDYEFILRILKGGIKLKMIPVVCSFMRTGGISSNRYLEAINEIKIAQQMHLGKRIASFNLFFLRFRYLQSQIMRLFDILGLGYFMGSIFKRKTFK